MILIPNEAHESTNQARNQYPLANQPYLPQNAVVNTGTAVTWFNGDVDHDRTITAIQGRPSSSEVDASAPIVFESGEFKYNSAVTTTSFNDTGVYTYFEKDLNEDDPAFEMNGTVTCNQSARIINTLIDR